MSGILYPSQKASEIAGFKIQTSVYGLPIPIVYGTTRIAANLIHMPNIPSISPGQGGKGITSKGATSGKSYNAAMILSLCEGQIAGIGNVWRDKDAKVAFTAYSAAGYGLATGTSGQTGWASLPSAQRLGYMQIAYVDNPNWPLPNDSLSSYSWEVKGFEIFGSGVVDASPADIIPDYLTNAQYGVGFPSAQLGDLTTFQDYCAAFSVFCSPAFVDQQPARDQLNDLLEIANTGVVWSDGVLKFVPYGDFGATAHGHTYTPNTTPVYDLTDHDYIPRGEGVDPVQVTRKSPIECFNQIVVEYEDRSFDYNVSSQKAEEQVSIITDGKRPMPPMALHAIKTAALAQQVAQIRLQREQNVRNEYKFKLGWRFILLEPMDLVTLTDSGLGLLLTPVRITQVEELEGEDGIEVTAEDWPFGTASATAYQTASNSGTTSNANVDPGNTTAPIIFEGPHDIYSSSPLEIWVGASGGQYWGGCQVYISVDNVNFDLVGTITGKAVFGDTTASLASNAAYPSIDTTHTLSVDLTSSGGSLVAQSNTQFTQLVPLCYLGGEFVAYRDLSLTSAFNYDLTHLYRGLYGSTIPGSHGGGTPFVFCDNRIARVPWPIGYVGQVVYFKFPAFNVFGGAQQDVASVSSVSHTIGSDPIIPGVVPSFEVVVTPGSTTYVITYTYFGTLEVNIDNAGWIADPGSPITVTLDDNSHTYDFRVSAGGQTIPNSVSIPSLRDAPTLELTVTPGATSYQIDYTYTGVFQLWIDGVGPASDPGTPITVSLDSSTHTYDFLISRGGQSIPNHVAIPSLATNPFTPAIDTIETHPNASTYDCDGANNFDITWTTINMPSGVTFDIVWTITSNGTGTGSNTGVTSPYTTTPNATICPGATVRITITAYVDGIQLAVGIFDSTV